MNFSLLKILLKSPTFTSWLSLSITMGVPLITIPLMSEVLTSTELALWLFTGTITGLGLLADFGFSNTITRITVYFHAGLTSIPVEQDIKQNTLEKKDKINAKGLMDLITTSRKIYFYITIGALFFLTILGVPMVWNIITTSPDTFNLWVAFALAIMYAVISIHSSRWFGIAQGFDMIHKVNIIKLIASSVELLVFISFVFFQVHLVFYSAFYLVKSFFFLFITEHLVKKKFELESGQLLYKGTFDKELFKIIWKPTRQQGVIFFGAYLINQGNSIVIAQTNDPIAISAFLFIRRIFDAIGRMSQVPFASNIQNIYKVITTKSSPEWRNYIAIALMSSILLMIFFFIVTYFTLPYLFSLFKSSIHMISTPVFLVMAVSLLLESHHSMHATIYAVTNKVPFVWQAMVSGISIFVISMVYTIKYGIIGIVLTQFIIQLLVNNWYPVYLSLKMLNWPVTDYLKSPIFFFKQIRTLTLFKHL